MSDEYLVAGSHPDTLASGRPIAPGDTVPASAVDPKDPHDQALLEAGVLVDVAADRKAVEQTIADDAKTKTKES